MITECPHCGGKNDIGQDWAGQPVKCSDCGKNFEFSNKTLMTCPDCFSLISKRASVCPRCGAPLGNKFSPGEGSHKVALEDISQEKKIAVYHPSAMIYLWKIILGIITIPILLGIGILIYVWIDIKSTRYELTTHRIIVTKGLLSKLQTEIWIKDMRGIYLVQGIWQRIIGVGNIAIGTAASAGTEINIKGIARPAEMINKINSLR